MPRKLKLALIGLGRRGRSSHLPIYPRMNEVFDFVAVCDKDEEVLREVAAEYGVNAYTSVRDLVDGEELDVVDVVVPGDAHHPICCYLAENGINIIVETPVSVTRPMTDMMTEAAERNNVKLEVAENYHRVPMARFQAKVIDSGIIGEVGRIYRIFYEGGYHGMSMLRLLAGSPPKSILGITHVTDVVPIIDRMKRHHSRENCTTSFLEFENGAAATMIYSNVIHARSLGRKTTGISQIDGTRGAIVGDTVYFTDPETYQDGAIAAAYEPQRSFIDVDGRSVLERISLELPDQEIVWQNPYAHLGIGENNGRGVDMADQFMSIANAVLDDIDPTYGVQEARLDQEMSLAASESALMNMQPLAFPLRSPSEAEQRILSNFKETYGYDYTETEPLLDVFYPRR